MPVKTAMGFEGVIVQSGPIARCVKDVTAGFRILVEANIRSPSGVFPPLQFHDPGKVDVSKLKIGLLSQIGGLRPFPAILRSLKLAVESLRDLVTTVEEWSQPDLQKAAEMFIRLLASDRFSLPKHPLQREKPVLLMKPNVQLASLPAPMVWGLTKFLQASGQKHLASVTGNAKRLSGQRMMELLYEHLKLEESCTNSLKLNDFNAVLCPALPVVVPLHQAALDIADLAGSLHVINALGMPTGVTPVQTAEESDRKQSRDGAEQAAARSEANSVGLLAAVQVVSRHWCEDIVLAVMPAREAQLSKNADYPNPANLKL